MYQPRSAQQKSSKIVKIALVISWLIIIAGIYYVFFWNRPDGGLDNDGNTTGNVLSGDTLTTNYYIGERVLEQGTLTPVDSFTTYTHTLTTDEGTVFGAKSKDHDLYQYSGEVQIKGTIDGFKQELPIIMVTEIIGDQLTANNAASGDLYNAEFYLFEDVGLGFDLSISQGFEVTEAGGNIVLHDSQGGADVLTISPFQCTSTESLKDCVALQDKFEEYNNENFTSSNGITFYNLTETNTWAAFNENSYGYYFNPSSSRDLINFADLMVFVDEKGIQSALEQEVDELCKNIDHTMDSIYELRVEYGEDGKAEVTAAGTTNQGNDATCKVIARLGTSYQFTLISFAVSQDTAEVVVDEEETDDTIIEDTDPVEEETVDETDNEVGVTPPEFDTPDEGFSGWLSYTSVRGFTLYFSSQAISYAGEVRESTDLGVAGLSCSYQVKIIEWKRADDIDANPDIVVYECSGEVSNGVLSAQNLTQIGTTENETILVAKYLTDTLASLQIGVE